MSSLLRFSRLPGRAHRRRLPPGSARRRLRRDGRPARRLLCPDRLLRRLNRGHQRRRQHAHHPSRGVGVASPAGPSQAPARAGPAATPARQRPPTPGLRDRRTVQRARRVTPGRLPAGVLPAPLYFAMYKVIRGLTHRAPGLRCSTPATSRTPAGSFTPWPPAPPCISGGWTWPGPARPPSSSRRYPRECSRASWSSPSGLGSGSSTSPDPRSRKPGAPRRRRNEQPYSSPSPSRVLPSPWHDAVLHHRQPGPPRPTSHPSQSSPLVTSSARPAGFGSRSRREQQLCRTTRRESDSTESPDVRPPSDAFHQASHAEVAARTNKTHFEHDPSTNRRQPVNQTPRRQRRDDDRAPSSFSQLLVSRTTSSATP